MRTVYLIGIPGSGKSTVVEAATAGRCAVDERQPFAHRVYDDGAIELGARRDSFSGTDALGMGVMPQAVAWIGQVDAPLVFGEGDRLGSAKFFSAARAVGRLEVVWLDAPAEVAAERRAARGSTQKAAWLKGRATKVERLGSDWATCRFDATDPVETLASALRTLLWPEVLA